MMPGDLKQRRGTQCIFKLDFLRKVVVGGCQGVSRRLLLSVFFFLLEDCYVVARVAKKNPTSSLCNIMSLDMV